MKIFTDERTKKMKQPRTFETLYVLSLLYQLTSSTSQNKGALQESFVVNLKAIKKECDANTASLLSVIEDLQQNVNTTLIKDLKDETRSLQKLVDDLNRSNLQEQEAKAYLNETVQQQQYTLQELRKIVEDQQRTIEQQNKTAQEQRSNIQQLNSMINRMNETDFKELKGEVENLQSAVREQGQIIQNVNESVQSDVHFTVLLSSDTSVPLGQTVKFDSVVTNVGSGYIDNSSHADYGKFVAPVSGTYQFLVTIMNSDMATNSKAKIDLVVNGAWKVLVEVREKEDVGTCHLVEKLNQGDKVWVRSATVNPNYFEKHSTSFSGHLIRADNF